MADIIELPQEEAQLSPEELRTKECSALIQGAIKSRDMDIFIYALQKYGMSLKIIPQEVASAEVNQEQSQDSPVGAPAAQRKTREKRK